MIDVAGASVAGLQHRQRKSPPSGCKLQRRHRGLLTTWTITTTISMVACLSSILRLTQPTLNPYRDPSPTRTLAVIGAESAFFAPNLGKERVSYGCELVDYV